MKRLDLCLHTGGHTVERPELSLVETPPAANGWVPIPHDELLDQVQDTLGASNYDVITESHALARGGNQYFGLMQVHAREAPNDDEYSTVIGLRNSHDKSFSAGLVLGSGVFVCDNLAFSGEIKLARKHTRFIRRDLPQIVQAGVDRLFHARAVQDTRIDAYRETDINDKQADHLIIQMLRLRIITSQHVVKVVNEWDKPTHEEFADQRNAWGLFNAVTAVQKGRLGALPRATGALHGLMDGISRPALTRLMAERQVEPLMELPEDTSVEMQEAA